MKNLRPLLFEVFIQLIELPQHLLYLAKLKINIKKYFKKIDNLSDSQKTPYEDFVRKVVKSEKKFNKFRRRFSYRLILEHLTYKQGLLYLDCINSVNSQILSEIDISTREFFKGKPYRFRYHKVGKTSPTTLRYLKVLTDLERLFNFGEIHTIAEIGIGYGGQCQIIHQRSPDTQFTLFDLDPVLELTRKYLGEDYKLICEYSSGNLPRNQIWDLVISNYAFSELPRSVQFNYIENVISKSPRGYMIMNSGNLNTTGRSEGKMSLIELKELIPGCEVFGEEPLTSPDNYLLVWGHKK
jgi:hypothetical protein